MDFNFKEFYQVLDSIFTKKRPSFEITESNFSLFLINRYISFYDPEICVYINEIANKNALIDATNVVECYEYLFNAIPKLPKRFIKYIKKKNSATLSQMEITDEELLKWADYCEISKREVIDSICTLKDLKII